MNEHIENQSILIRRADALITDFRELDIKACNGMSWNRSSACGKQMLKKAIEACKEAVTTEMQFSFK